jgi:hypothetical protein
MALTEQSNLCWALSSIWLLKEQVMIVLGREGDEGEEGGETDERNQCRAG